MADDFEFGDDDFGYWDFPDLQKRKIAKSRKRLREMILYEGFPEPVKRRQTRQAAADYFIPKVKAWCKARDERSAEERKLTKRTGIHGKSQTVQPAKDAG